jgi:hypothetical protein
MEKQDVLKMATERFKGMLKADHTLVIRIMAGTVGELTTQLSKLTGKEAGEIGGPAILRAVSKLLDTGKLSMMTPDWDSKEREAVADLVVNGIALAFCQYVVDLV